MLLVASAVSLAALPVPSAVLLVPLGESPVPLAVSEQGWLVSELALARQRVLQPGLVERAGWESAQQPPAASATTLQWVIGVDVL